MKRKGFIFLLLILGSFLLLHPLFRRKNSNTQGFSISHHYDYAYVNAQNLSSLDHLFSENAPINRKIPADAVVDERNDEYIRGLVESGDFVIALRKYSPTVYVFDGEIPRQTVALACGDEWELGISAIKAVPLLNRMVIAQDVEGEDFHSCAEDSDADNALAIVDVHNGCEYDFWQSRIKNGNLEASWGTAFPLDSNGISPTGLSARGSGFALTAGLIFPHELRSGEIRHALAFSYSLTKSGGPVLPATESDGESEDPRALPEGALLRLNPSLDLDALGLRPYEKVIAKALQSYGMYLVDNGGDTGIAIYAANPISFPQDIYKGILPDTDYVPLEHIPLTEFQVLSLTKQDSSFQEKLSPAENRCTRYVYNSV